MSLFALRAIRPIIVVLIIGAGLAGSVKAGAPEWFSTFPEPDEITALAVDPAQPTRIYAGTAHFETSTDFAWSWNWKVTVEYLNSA